MESLPLTMAAKVLVVSAPSGAGKTTLVNAALRHFDQFSFSISATTRPPRAHEIHGREYYFLSETSFLEKKAEGEFLEYEEVYPGRWYGTLSSEVDRILETGNWPIFDVDVEGGLNIKKYYGEEAMAIFIQPPHPEVLLERLKRRGTDDEAEIRRRYAKARHELTYASRFDHIIVNDVLEKSIEELTQLIDAEFIVGAK